MEANAEVDVLCQDIVDSLVRSRERFYTATQHRSTQHPVGDRSALYRLLTLLYSVSNHHHHNRFTALFPGPPG